MLTAKAPAGTGGIEMSYIDILKEAKDQVTPGMSACQGCGGELILRTILKIAGENTKKEEKGRIKYSL